MRVRSIAEPRLALLFAAALAHCASAQQPAATNTASPSASASPAPASTEARPERRQMARADWDRARTAGEYESIPVPEGVARTETGCMQSDTETPVPAGTVRMYDAVPGGSNSTLYRERGTDRVWVVVESAHFSAPAGQATPSTHCFQSDVPLPTGTRAAGTISVGN